MAGGDKSKGKHVSKKRKDDHGDYSDFMFIHFPQLQLRKHFLDHFKPRTIITPYFVNLNNMENLEICDNSPLKSQALPLQTQILHYVLHHVITPRAGHADEVSRLDVAILDCILEERVLNIGYIILHHMLRTPNLAKRSLPYASIIT